MDVRFRSRPSVRVALGIILIFGVCIVFTTAVLMASGSSKEDEFEALPTPAPTICTTPVCVTEAAYISSIIDDTANPCRNFYKFARGNSNGDEFDLMKAKIRQQFIDLYNEPRQKGEDVMVTSMKTLYRLCMKELPFDLSQSTSVARIKRAIGIIYEGWPILKGSSWDETMFDWQQRSSMIYNQHGYTFQLFFNLSVIVDPRNASKHIFKMSLPKLDMIQNEVITNVLRVLGPDDSVAERDITEIHKFAEKLLKEEDVTVETNSTIKDKICYGPQQKVLINLLRVTILKLVHPIVLSDDDILFEEPEKILNRFRYIESQPKRVIANYMLLRILEEIVKELDINSTPNLISDANKQKYCFEKIYNRFIPNPMDVLYVERYTTVDRLQKVGILSRNIKEEFLELLRTAKWLHPSKMDKFSNELGNVPMVIGAPENFISGLIFDDLNRIMFFWTEDWVSDNFLSLLMRLKKNYQRYSFQLFTKSMTDAKFHRWNLMEATEVVVDPTHAHNITVLPATILQGVLYDENRPNYLNYATLGRILLAELLVYNNFIEAYGNSSWEYDYLPLSEHMEFRKVTYCPITKGLTAGVCVNSSFSAYKKQETTLTNLELLDIDYTSNQLFWIYSIPFGLSDDKYHSIIDEMAKGNPHITEAFNCPWGPKNVES